MITLNTSDFGTFTIENESGKSVLVQSDWEFPGIASTFGWSIRSVQHDEDCACNHNGTDGTVDCKDCGLTASEFISAAQAWLDDNDGAEAEDPGYFNGSEG